MMNQKTPVLMINQNLKKKMMNEEDILVSYKTETEKEWDRCFTKMVIFMLVIGSKIRDKAMGRWIIGIKIIIQANGKMTIEKEKENYGMLMEICIKVNLKMMLWMVKERLPSKMERFMKEGWKLIRCMEMELWPRLIRISL